MCKVNKKYSIVEHNPSIQIFKKKEKKVFCEIEIPDEEYLKELQSILNGPQRFVLFGALLIDKSEIDHIIFKN